MHELARGSAGVEELYPVWSHRREGPGQTLPKRVAPAGKGFFSEGAARFRPPAVGNVAGVVHPEFVMIVVVQRCVAVAGVDKGEQQIRPLALVPTEGLLSGSGVKR